LTRRIIWQLTNARVTFSCDYLDLDDLDKLSVSSFFYKGYKYGGSRLGRQSSRLSNYSWITSQKHGIPSPEKHDFSEIINHGYVFDNLRNKALHKSIIFDNLIGSIRHQKVLPKFTTKASKLRDEFLKNYRLKMNNSVNEGHKDEWKLRQFLGIGPSEDILGSIRRIKKTVILFM
jgi:hypothetical protein